MSDLGQNLFEPPTVKGWEGGRLWINSASMLQRANFASEVMTGTRFGEIVPRQKGSASAKVGAYLDLLIAAEVSRSTREDLTNYLRRARGSAEGQTKGLVQLIMTMPEYQLI